MHTLFSLTAGCSTTRERERERGGRGRGRGRGGEREREREREREALTRQPFSFAYAFRWLPKSMQFSQSTHCQVQYLVPAMIHERTASVQSNCVHT